MLQIFERIMREWHYLRYRSILALIRYCYVVCYQNSMDTDLWTVTRLLQYDCYDLSKFGVLKRQSCGLLEQVYAVTGNSQVPFLEFPVHAQIFSEHLLHLFSKPDK